LEAAGSAVRPAWVTVEHVLPGSGPFTERGGCCRADPPGSG
jgi:hypothetical protein